MSLDSGGGKPMKMWIEWVKRVFDGEECELLETRMTVKIGMNSRNLVGDLLQGINSTMTRYQNKDSFLCCEALG